jgi:hypothetical protein
VLERIGSEHIEGQVPRCMESQMHEGQGYTVDAKRSNSARSGSVSWAWRERVIDARSDSGSRYMEGKGHRCDLCVLGGTGSCIGTWRGRILKMGKKT